MNEAGNAVPPSTISVDLSLLVSGSSNTRLVEVIGWVSWVHYSWNICWEECGISFSLIVDLPVDAGIREVEERDYMVTEMLVFQLTHSMFSWFSTEDFITVVVL